MITLNQAKKGITYLINSISDSSIQSKLMEMGIIEGKEIEITNVAPFGDPIIVRISGYKLMLRRKEAQTIKITSI
jgi:ferrous iron transport protein A|tara:strand:- start:780 stop:1004 length:225 start_codon:yes stop_codon:yes gene_type:complete